jgi:Arc/MetJ-type ribon-helix-helix transcriptional regulator
MPHVRSSTHCVHAHLSHGIAFCNIGYYYCPMVTVSVKLSPALASRLTAEARKKRVSKSDLIRDSLQRTLTLDKNKSARKPTVGDLVGHLMGKLKGGPHDLSTNKKHMEGFGE